MTVDEPLKRHASHSLARAFDDDSLTWSDRLL